MKKLIENEFIGTGEVKDFKFTRIAFSKYADLYEVNRGGTQVHFEVFKRKFAPVCINFENRIYSETEFKQVFPKVRTLAFGHGVFLIRKELFRNLMS